MIVFNGFGGKEPTLSQILDDIHISFICAHLHVYGYISIDFLNNLIKKKVKKLQVTSLNATMKSKVSMDLEKEYTNEAPFGLLASQTTSKEPQGEERRFIMGGFLIPWIVEEHYEPFIEAFDGSNTQHGTFSLMVELRSEVDIIPLALDLSIKPPLPFIFVCTKNIPPDYFSYPPKTKGRRV